MILLKIKKRKLINILNILNLISEKKPINQTVENFLLLKKYKKIYFIGKNKNMKIKIKIKTKNIYFKKNISINFSIKNFIKIIKNFPECIINLILKKKNIIIKNKHIKYSLKIKKTNNYLLIKKKKYIHKFLINKIMLYELINSVYFLVKNTNKEIENTSLISFINNKMEILSTDNYRLIYDNIKISNKIKFKKNIIIPNKILFIIHNILKSIKKKNILIKINKFQIKFKIKNLKITAKIINKKYPNFKNNLKKKYKKNFFINKKELLFSLKRSISIMEKTNNFSKWIISKNNLTISTEWNSNKVKEVVNINYYGKNISFGINANYILELISNINAEEINFNFSKKNKYLIISNPNKKNFKYITNIVKI